jgi:hypothetical protein
MQSDAYCEKIIDVGKEQAVANRLKLTANYILLVLIDLMGQVFTVGEKSNIDLQVMSQVMMMEIIFSSPALQEYARRIRTRDNVGYSLPLAFKDVQLILESSVNFMFLFHMRAAWEISFSQQLKISPIKTAFPYMSHPYTCRAEVKWMNADYYNLSVVLTDAIVCDDVDIEKASSGAVKGRFVNNGQSCIATKRFVVVKKIANEFIENAFWVQTSWDS